MIYKIRVWLWSIVAELEYQLYPWTTDKPPTWAVDRYNLDDNYQHDQHEEQFNFEWLKCHEDKIAKLQLEMIHITEEVRKLRDGDQKKH